jgi:hypothetical protein
LDTNKSLEILLRTNVNLLRFARSEPEIDVLGRRVPAQASLLTCEASDCFILKPGYVGAGRNLETVRKV